MTPGFQGSPEYQTLSEMADSIERGEPEAFEATTNNYWFRKMVKEDQKDRYLVMMFDRNKAEIKERPEDFS